MSEAVLHAALAGLSVLAVATIVMPNDRALVRLLLQLGRAGCAVALAAGWFLVLTAPADVPGSIKRVAVAPLIAIAAVGLLALNLRLAAARPNEDDSSTDP